MSASSTHMMYALLPRGPQRLYTAALRDRERERRCCRKQIVACWTEIRCWFRRKRLRGFTAFTRNEMSIITKPKAHNAREKIQQNHSNNKKNKTGDNTKKHTQKGKEKGKHEENKMTPGVLPPSSKRKQMEPEEGWAHHHHHHHRQQ